MNEKVAASACRITLIGTMHNPLGRCNVLALYNLLKALAPEVIFEERRAGDDVTVCNAAWRSLDQQAISRYVQGKEVRLVPVDDYQLPTGFRVDADRMFDHVIAHSPEYRSLQRVADEEAYEHGFAYLNSPGWAALHKRQQALMQKTVEQSGNVTIQQALISWNTLIHKRELTMVDSVYAFARVNAFTTGVLLVGAAHTASIAEIINTRPVADKDVITWDLCIGLSE